MNILLINYEFPPLGAGASTATYHIGKELAGMGHNIVVLTSGYKKQCGYDFTEGMTVFRCHAVRKKISESNILEMLSFVVSAFFYIPWILVKHKIQGAIVFFSFPCGPLGLWAKLLYGIPYIISLRGGDVPGTERKLDRIHKILTPVRRIILKKSRAVIANSEGLKQLAQKADPISISVVHNGIDTNFFKPPKLKKTKSDFNLVFVGRISEQKNLSFILKQIAGAKRKQTISGLKLHIVGDGPLRAQVEAYGKELGISDSITWYGWVNKNQIVSLCRKADFFVNPSLYEGMPNAVLEAMACGLPVLASNVAGNNEVVVDGENGILFNLDDPEEFSAFLAKIAATPQMYTELGLTARKNMVMQFSWNRTAQEYIVRLNEK